MSTEANITNTKMWEYMKCTYGMTIQRRGNTFPSIPFLYPWVLANWNLSKKGKQEMRHICFRTNPNSPNPQGGSDTEPLKAFPQTTPVMMQIAYRRSHYTVKRFPSFLSI